MRDAVVRGASSPDIQGVDLRVTQPLEARPEDGEFVTRLYYPITAEVAA